MHLVIATTIWLCLALKTGIATAGVAPCTGPVTVEVSTGSPPEINWDPACDVDLMLVELTSSGSDRWVMTSDGANSISPPVTYGLVPAGAREWQAPLALQAGVEYVAIVFRWIGPDEQDWELIGFAEFTPPVSVDADEGTWSALKGRYGHANR